VAPAELDLLVGSVRIARKRFPCDRPVGAVRLRSNGVGRTLPAREAPGPGPCAELAAGRTVAWKVLLVSRRG
jgi:hypothetical protein